MNHWTLIQSSLLQGWRTFWYPYHRNQLCHCLMVWVYMCVTSFFVKVISALSRRRVNLILLKSAKYCWCCKKKKKSIKTLNRLKCAFNANNTSISKFVFEAPQGTRNHRGLVFFFFSPFWDFFFHYYHYYYYHYKAAAHSRISKGHMSPTLWLTFGNKL